MDCKIHSDKLLAVKRAGIWTIGILLFAATMARADMGFASSFDKYYQGWQTVGAAEFVFDGTVGHDAPGAVRLVVRNNITSSWQRFCRSWGPINPDDDFEATIWVRTEDVHDGNGAYMAMEFLDADGRTTGIAHSRVNLSNGAREWERLSVQGVAPAKSVRVQINLVLHAHGTAWFDDFRFARTWVARYWFDLGSAPRIVTIDPTKVVQPHFRGVGFHVFHHSHKMSEQIKDEVVYKRWREIDPSFARLNDQNNWTQAQREEVTDHLRRLGETGIEIYMTGWDAPDVPPGAERRAYAKEVADRMEFFLKQKHAARIKWYCFSNELQIGRLGPGALLCDLPKFKDYHQELFDEFQARGLPIGLLATDASGIDNWHTIDWAAQNMDSITAVYGGHYYFNEHSPENLHFCPWFGSKLKRMVDLAHNKGKEFILGEFGAKYDGRTINGKLMDTCVYFDTPQEPLVGLQLSEAAVAGMNTGVYAMCYWTFMDFPEGDIPTYANKWGLFKWSGNDFSTRAIYYSFGPLVKFFRGPATVVSCKTNDPRVRAAAVCQPSGAWSIVVVNRNHRNVPLQVKLSIAADKPLVFRKYVYDPTKIRRNRFGDLPGPDGTIMLFGGELRDTLGPNTQTIYTTAYDTTPPTPVHGIKTETKDGSTLVSWQANSESDICYYRVFRGTTPDFKSNENNQVASTISTTFEDKVSSTGALYKVLAVDMSGNMSVVETDSKSSDEKQPK